jgi:hypothetical protein
MNAVEPPLYEAFSTTNLRPASATSRGRRRSEEQLDALISLLLWHNQAGLVENIIRSVLRGDDYYYSRAEQKPKPLWPPLLLSRARGRKPGLLPSELRASLQRLVDRGEVTRTGSSRYRLSRYVANDKARTAIASERLA